jgi:hypothetical protein
MEVKENTEIAPFCALKPRTTWGQPPSAVRRSVAPQLCGSKNLLEASKNIWNQDLVKASKNLVELRSTGQPRAAVPTWLRGFKDSLKMPNPVTEVLVALASLSI